MAPTLYLTCGLPGAGKTIRALELEVAGAVRLTSDDWLVHLYPTDADAAARDDRRDLVESLQWHVAERLLQLGLDVVVDWGVWQRAERDDYRDRATALGASVRLEFVDAPLDELRRRVAERNRDLPPGALHIADHEMIEFATQFDRPTPDELPD